MLLLGYLIRGADTKDYLLGYKQELIPPHPCNRYRSIYEIDFLPESFLLARKKKDFYGTMDGFMLVSENVKSFCKTNKYKNIQFKKIRNSSYYWLKPNNIIEFDSDTRKVWFKDYNKKCKGYDEIIGATPVCLIDKSPLKDGFYRTDISFGGYGKSPLICIGTETQQKIKSGGFTGIQFEKIYDRYKKLPDMEFLKKASTDPNFSFLDILDD